MKSIKKLALYLCKQESGKEEVDIAQITEIVGKLSELWASLTELELYELNVLLETNGHKRLKKKLKAKHKG